MGEYPALSEQEIEAIVLQMQKMSLGSKMSLRYLNITINNPAI